MKVFTGVAELRTATGSQLGVSDWLSIDQSQIDTFADATGDHQWIHVDGEKARNGPFGTTIAHGFLTLSLVPVLSWQVYQVQGVTMTINYGFNRVRFTAPVPVGSRVRGNVELIDVSDVTGGVQVTNKVTIEIEGSERPAVVAESLLRYYV
ncbi:MAG: MaoC family dehydratase [Pseudonocardia sp.]